MTQPQYIVTEQEREELIEKMRTVLINARLMGFDYESAARAALAVAEPVIREQCAGIAEKSLGTWGQLMPSISPTLFGREGNDE